MSKWNIFSDNEYDGYDKIVKSNSCLLNLSLLSCRVTNPQITISTVFSLYRYFLWRILQDRIQNIPSLYLLYELEKEYNSLSKLEEIWYFITKLFWAHLKD